MKCETDNWNIEQSRPYGACPGAPATMQVLLRYRRSRRETTHYLCTTCTKAFTRHYMAKGHRVTQHVLAAGDRRTLLEALAFVWSALTKNGPDRDFLFGKQGPIMPRPGDL